MSTYSFTRDMGFNLIPFVMKILKFLTKTIVLQILNDGEIKIQCKINSLEVDVMDIFDDLALSMDLQMPINMHS